MIDTNVLRVLSAKGANDNLLKKLCVWIGDMDCTLDDICSNRKLMCSLGINKDVAENIYKAKELALYLKDRLSKDGIDMLWCGDYDFPLGIKELKSGNVPAVIFYKGNYNLVKQKCVGFMGSREVSDLGMNITKESVKQLSENEVTIISGYAKGVDITVHQTALEEGGSTIFVIAEGILKSKVKYEIRDLLTAENHLFISQFHPINSWSSYNVMKRNNTIVGLADVMILIEAGLNGKTFDIGQQSLKNDKPLFVIDCAISKLSAGGNPYFIKRGGISIQSDKSGIPDLKDVFMSLESKQKINDYEKLKLTI